MRQAGTTPDADSAPSEGFSPTMPLSAAGTRPDPAVSVPSEKGTSPAPTAVAEPELEPPGMRSGRKRIARDAIGRAHADEAGRELIEIGLADDDRAGALEPLDDEGRRLRLVGEGGTGGGGRQAGDVDIVLDDERDAEQRFALAARPLAKRPAIASASALGRSAMKSAGSLCRGDALVGLLDRRG